MDNTGRINHNSGYYFPPSAQASSSSAAASQAPAVQHPPQLYSSRVNTASLGWLQQHASNPDASARALSQQMLSAISSSALTLGNPASQSATNAQFGTRLRGADNNPVTLIANFRPDGNGNYNLMQAAMRNSQGQQVRLTAPRAAQPAAVASSSRAASEAVVTATRSAISPASRSRIRSITSGLLRWEKEAAKNQIETRLHNTPADQHVMLLNHLSSQLSTASASTKAGVIAQWSQHSTIERATASHDLRTPLEREMQDRLNAALRDPVFAAAKERICNMLPGDIRDRVIVSSIQHSNYYSLLYRRVFADSRPPAEAIQALEQHLSRFAEPQCYDAMREWQPQQ